MAGRGPAPDPRRVRRGKPARGDWQPSPDGGWQHPIPEPPAGLTDHSTEVWSGWFKAWWAANWTQDDVPQLRLVIRVYDRVMRGDIRRLGELRQLMDSFGITPKGQMDRRWQRPAPPTPPSWLERNAMRRSGRYDHLRYPGEDRPLSASERFAVLEDKDRSRSIEQGRTWPLER
jgi:hypothetical protein